MRYKPVNNFLFEKNRQRLCRLLPSHSLTIIFSNDEIPRTADQFFPFRQNSDLFYLCGIEQPKTILVLFPDSHDVHFREILFVEKPTEYQLTWSGNRLTFEKASEISGLKNIFWLDEFENVLSNLMQQSKFVYLSFHEEARSFEEVPQRDFRFTEKIKNLYPLHHYERLAPLMAELRIVKQPEEIEYIQSAIKITHLAFDKIIETLQPNIPESAIEAEIIAAFLRNNSSGHAFLPIVASGANACVLHYSSNDSVCKKNDLLLVDFGAEYANYNADITRTFPIGGSFTKRQRDVYNAVLRLHERALTIIKPGNTIEKINQQMVPFFEEEMLKLKLLKQEDINNQNAESPAYKKYFMHGISHYLGLDVHDVGSKLDPLVPGMVITCEPGLYIREEGIGIRLENDILITENGNINLSSAIPIQADEVEELMARRHDS